MPNKKLAREIYKLQNVIVRSLNDSLIFLEQAEPLLAEAKKMLGKGQSKSKRRYYVPSVGRNKFAKRTDEQLKEIYDYYLDEGLFETFLTNSVSQFESFLGDVLYEFFVHYPLKLSEKVPNCPACPDIPPKDVVASKSKRELLDAVIGRHLSNIFRQRPEVYMSYICKILDLKKDPSFQAYYEIAATRDLIVHNDLYVNDLYLEKAKKRARGRLNDRLTVDRDYYHSALAQMKKVSGALKREVQNKYASA